MSLIRWQPVREELRPSGLLEREMDRMFGDFFTDWALPWRYDPAVGSDSGFVPSINLKETDTAYQLTAEVPGIDREHLDVNLKDGVVTISGERRDERTEEKGSYHRRETCFGSFCRTIALPGDVDGEKVAAQLKDGVLTLELPKVARAENKGKKIDVRSA